MHKRTTSHIMTRKRRTADAAAAQDYAWQWVEKRLEKGERGEREYAWRLGSSLVNVLITFILHSLIHILTHMPLLASILPFMRTKANKQQNICMLSQHMRRWQLPLASRPAVAPCCCCHAPLFWQPPIAAQVFCIAKQKL